MGPHFDRHIAVCESPGVRRVSQVVNSRGPISRLCIVMKHMNGLGIGWSPPVLQINS